MARLTRGKHLAKGMGKKKNDSNSHGLADWPVPNKPYDFVDVKRSLTVITVTA